MILSTTLLLSVCTVTFIKADDMGEILSAETRSGSISYEGEDDTFTFNGEEGQTTVINMSRESGGLNPYMILYDPTGGIETSASGYDHAVINDHQLLQSGTYTILVRDTGGDDSGNYSISLLLIPGPTVSPQDPDGGDVISGESRYGSISMEADTDAYTFEGEAGQTTVLSMSRESGGLNPYIVLYDPEGAIETSASGYDHAEINDHQLLQSGLYTIVLGDDGGDDNGNYSMTYTKIPGTQYSPSIRVLINQTGFGPGETLTVSVHITNGSSPAEVEIKTWAALPGGYQISILDPHFSATIPPYADITRQISSYTFTGYEPGGIYDVGARLLNKKSGREISVNIENFSFAP